MRLRFWYLQVWSEVVGGGGTVNFLTGAGGFLQNVIFGYVGFELTVTSLAFDPHLPQGVTSITAVNVDYLGNSFDLKFDDSDVTITLQEVKAIAQSLHVCVSGSDFALSLKSPYKFQLAKGEIKSANLKCQN